MTGGINYTVDGQAEERRSDQFIGGDIYYYKSVGQLRVHADLVAWRHCRLLRLPFDEDGWAVTISPMHISRAISRRVQATSVTSPSLSKADKEAATTT